MRQVLCELKNAEVFGLLDLLSLRAAELGQCESYPGQ